jgi:hypothetical protein
MLSNRLSEWISTMIIVIIDYMLLQLKLLHLHLHDNYAMVLVYAKQTKNK